MTTLKLINKKFPRHLSSWNMISKRSLVTASRDTYFKSTFKYVFNWICIFFVVLNIFTLLF